MKTPKQEIFENMKSVADKIWDTYDDTYGYVSDKMLMINSIENIQDNAMVFYRMFDSINQMKMRQLVSKESLEYIKNNS